MHIHRSALVSYSCEQMFALVHNVAAYPEFIVDIERVDIISSNESEIAARLFVKKGPVRQSFATRNAMNAPYAMTMVLEDGPFNYLTGKWLFTELSNVACKVEFSLDFEVKNKLLSLALTPVISKLADQMVESFCQRAKKVYE